MRLEISTASLAISGSKPASRVERPCRNRRIAPTLVVYPRIGRRQKTEGVRKLVTRRYPYLVYYTVDQESEEIVILTIQHPAREREHSDV